MVSAMRSCVTGKPWTLTIQSPPLSIYNINSLIDAASLDCLYLSLGSWPHDGILIQLLLYKVKVTLAMGRATIAFRSKPISARSHQFKTTQWKPFGPFRFFDLPPELRRQILENLVRDPVTAHRHVLCLFLTSERLYSEAASLYYHEVVLDITHRTRPEPFLTGPFTRVSPRRYVRTLNIHFYISERIHRFYTLYASAIRDMVEHGTLRRLELEIHSRFPAEDFWGGDNDTDLASQVLVKNKGKGKEFLAPRFAIEHSFQTFLKFLKDANVPQLRLYVDAADHHPFWCKFHRAPGLGNCEGEWKGKTKMLKVKWKDVVTILGGARVTKTAPQ